MVTASTLHKQKLFNSASKMDYLGASLLEVMGSFGWKIQAWAAFSNHYHFVGVAPEDPQIAKALGRLHGRTSRELNKMDGVIGRQVWFQYRDNALTYEKSYLARLSYVHRNAAKHGIVNDPTLYRWCSARWFSERATSAQFNTIMNLPIDTVNVEDDF